MDCHASEKLVTIHPKKIVRNLWITKGILKSSKTLRKLYKLQLDKPNNDNILNKYLKYPNTFNKLKQKSKTEYFREILIALKVPLSILINKSLSNEYVTSPQNCKDNFYT